MIVLTLAAAMTAVQHDSPVLGDARYHRLRLHNDVVTKVSKQAFSISILNTIQQQSANHLKLTAPLCTDGLCIPVSLEWKIPQFFHFLLKPFNRVDNSLCFTREQMQSGYEEKADKVGSIFSIRIPFSLSSSPCAHRESAGQRL